MKFRLCPPFGQEPFELEISDSPDEMLVGQLKERLFALSQLSSIPAAEMRVIFKGRVLDDAEQPLSFYGTFDRHDLGSDRVAFLHSGNFIIWLLLSR